jgi:hypothetical protein
MPEPGEARVTSDGSALRLRSRVLEFDPTGPRVVREVLTESLRDGAVEREERRAAGDHHSLRDVAREQRGPCV